MRRHAKIEAKGIAINPSICRFEVYRQARQLNIYGYVRCSIPNDLVIAAEGEEEQLQQYIFWCENTLLSTNHLMHVEFSDILLNYNEFRILST